jgi:hypothetical protein
MRFSGGVEAADVARGILTEAGKDQRSQLAALHHKNQRTKQNTHHTEHYELLQRTIN